FLFEEASPDALLEACRRFVDWFEPEARDRRTARWQALVDRGMAVDFDWRAHSAPAYLEAYRRAVAIRRERA
ncbi:MAG TPA: hypothetical protein VIU37_12265, partial [Candidatus Limnocylindrales bacterium]